MRGYDHATIVSPSFYGLRKERLAQWSPTSVKNRRKSPGGGYFQKNWVGVCGTLPETLTLFQTKICDFPYPISDLIKNLIPYFRPEALEPGAWPERVTGCYSTHIKREMVLSPNDEEVASSKKHTQFKTGVHNHTLFQTKTAKKPYPWASLTPYIAYLREYPRGRKTRCRLWVLLLTQARLIRDLLIEDENDYTTVRVVRDLTGSVFTYFQKVDTQESFIIL